MELESRNLLFYK